MISRKLPPTHPGEVLREEPNERGITLAKLSRDTRIPSAASACSSTPNAL